MYALTNPARSVHSDTQAIHSWKLQKYTEIKITTNVTVNYVFRFLFPGRNRLLFFRFIHLESYSSNTVFWNLNVRIKLFNVRKSKNALASWIRPVETTNEYPKLFYQVYDAYEYAIHVVNLTSGEKKCLF